MPCLWIRRLHISNMNDCQNDYHSKLIYRFSAIPIKIPTELFCKNWQADYKMTKNSQNNFEKKIGDITLVKALL